MIIIKILVIPGFLVNATGSKHRMTIFPLHRTSGSQSWDMLQKEKKKCLRQTVSLRVEKDYMAQPVNPTIDSL